VAGAAALLVFDNVVEVNPSDPIRSVRCDAARYFDNRTLAGMLLPRTDPNTLKPIEELDIPAEDTLVASLYEKA